MAAIYQADIWCDDCADAIRQAIQADNAAPTDPDDETGYDSDEYPKWASDDDESDAPTHCAGGSDCPNAETLPSGRKVGQLLGQLTTDGEEYVLAAHQHQPSEITELWLKFYEIDVVQALSE